MTQIILTPVNHGYKLVSFDPDIIVIYGLKLILWRSGILFY